MEKRRAASPQCLWPWRARGLWASGWLLALIAALSAADVHAQTRSDPPPLLAPDGLNGGRYVGSALANERPSLRFSASVGYGFTESVLGQSDHHHRVAGELAAALVLAPWFQAVLGGELRVDKHSPDGPGSETGVLGSSQIVTRHVLALGRRVALGFSPKVLFPGADSVPRGFRAASYELVALLSGRLSEHVELSLNAGYRFDRTRYAVRDAANLEQPQRLAAELSAKKNAYLLGALLSLSQRAFRVAAEWSWQLVSSGHPLESPMRVRVALQRVVAERFLPGIELAVEPSRRPPLVGLTRIEPRVWVRLGLAVLLDRPMPPVERPAQVAASKPPPLLPVLRSVKLHILDMKGQPVAGARIEVPIDGDHASYTTDAQGNVTLQVPAGVTAVTIEAPGYEPLWRTLAGEAKQEIAVVLKPRLPAGEVKGVVRNLAGDPLYATVTVLPEALTVTTDAQGQFAIGVAPGDYVLKIMADGYEAQERRAQVELRGVTIIVVDLRKVSK